MKPQEYASADDAPECHCGHVYLAQSDDDGRTYQACEHVDLRRKDGKAVRHARMNCRTLGRFEATEC